MTWPTPVMLEGMKAIVDSAVSPETMGHVHRVGVRYEEHASTEVIDVLLEESSLIRAIRSALIRTQDAVLLLANPIPTPSKCDVTQGG